MKSISIEEVRTLHQFLLLPELDTKIDFYKKNEHGFIDNKNLTHFNFGHLGNFYFQCGHNLKKRIDGITKLDYHNDPCSFSNLYNFIHNGSLPRLLYLKFKILTDNIYDNFVVLVEKNGSFIITGTSSKDTTRILFRFYKLYEKYYITEFSMSICSIGYDNENNFKNIGSISSDQFTLIIDRVIQQLNNIDLPKIPFRC